MDAVTCVLVFLMGLVFQTKSAVKTVSPEEANVMISKDSSIVLLDVRTKAEFESETGHLQNAILIPIDELEQRVDELDSCKGRTIIAVCRSGQRSGRATQILARKGFHALNLEGGMVRWNSKHLPVVVEKNSK
jgi:rhodanese-related sulfurtransferase